ncbi:MAG: DUF4328 domain-containing protein [Bacillota bacterium]
MEDIQSNPSRFFSNQVLSRAVIIAVSLAILTDLIGVYSGFLEIGLLSKVKQGFEITTAEANVNDTRQGIIGVFQVLVYFLYFILFLVWVNRSNKNLTALGIKNKKFSSGWAVGWFFIPIASLFKPYQVMKEIWQGSSSLDVEDEGIPLRSYESTSLINLWWTFFIISSIVGQISFRLAMAVDTVDMIYTSSIASVASDILSIFEQIITIIVVYKITSFQVEKHSFINSKAQQNAEREYPLV